MRRGDSARNEAAKTAAHDSPSLSREEQGRERERRKDGEKQRKGADEMPACPTPPCLSANYLVAGGGRKGEAVMVISRNIPPRSGRHRR